MRRCCRCTGALRLCCARTRYETAYFMTLHQKIAQGKLTAEETALLAELREEIRKATTPFQTFLFFSFWVVFLLTPVWGFFLLLAISR